MGDHVPCVRRRRARLSDAGRIMPFAESDGVVRQRDGVRLALEARRVVVRGRVGASGRDLRVEQGVHRTEGDGAGRQAAATCAGVRRASPRVRLRLVVCGSRLGPPVAHVLVRGERHVCGLRPCCRAAVAEGFLLLKLSALPAR
eukprot:scaffold408_cov388-Prasinococcus_capsulatus_cf.AAC.19